MDKAYKKLKQYKKAVEMCTVYYYVKLMNLIVPILSVNIAQLGFVDIWWKTIEIVE